MIPEREREALMRLTMCARLECSICIYEDKCDVDFQYELATKNMNILADALRKTEQNCDTCKHYDSKREAIACERCLDGKYSRYEPQTEQTGCSVITDTSCEVLDAWQTREKPKTTDCP